MLTDEQIAELRAGCDDATRRGLLMAMVDTADLAALLSAHADAVRLREAIENDPELPGDMPDHMWAAVSVASRDHMQEIMRAVVRATKKSILRAASRPARADTVGLSERCTALERGYAAACGLLAHGGKLVQPLSRDERIERQRQWVVAETALALVGIARPDATPARAALRPAEQGGA